MNLITIILFFAYTYGIGFTITSFIKNSENALERNLMRIGIGLGTLPFIIVALGWLHIPLDWRIFLLLSLAFPSIYLFKNYKNIKSTQFKLKINKSDIYVFLVLLLFAFTFFMYHKGAFAYPWLEDDDSWTHAYGAKYVSIEKTFFEPIRGKNTFQYMDAYPPAYDALIGILHQTSPSMMWTIKFFNALIISLGIVFFYFFVKEFTQSRDRALLSTFFLAMVPCFLSHFIWAHGLIVILAFPMFYAFERITYDGKWAYISALLFAGLWLSELTEAIKITVLLVIYVSVKALIEKRFLKKEFLAVGGGLIVAFLIWWLPMLLKYRNNLLTLGLSQPLGEGVRVTKNYIGRIGSAGRLYTFNDFFYATENNVINNPVGVGIVLCILSFISIIYLLAKYKSLLSKGNSWKLITLLWLLFTFLGIHGGTRLPIAFWSFRFWMLFAIPLSIIASEGALFLIALSKNFKINKYIIIALIFIGVILTSGQAKYSINTTAWGPGGWLGPIRGETEGFLWLKDLPTDTKVFVFSNMYKFVIGFDKFSCEWCPDVIEFRKTGMNSSAKEVYSWLNGRNYEYVLIDAYYSQDRGLNKTNEKLNELVLSGLFSPVHTTEGVIILKLK